MDRFTETLCTEIRSRSEYLTERKQDSLYFGGGTPSCMEFSSLEKIVRVLESIYDFVPDTERTIEINPEDAQIDKLLALKKMGFNRLSIGIQSFNNGILKRINRRHSASQAIRAIRLAGDAGFDNISMDLIIGLPGQEIKDIEYDIEIIKSLLLSHISVYILSVDSNSVFEKMALKGQFRPEDEDSLAEKYQFVSGRLRQLGFEHYEISNFARDGRFSRHNTAYWQQKPYIGLGPSAHSYNGESRQWNIANVKIYIESLNNNVLNFEKELLSITDKYNEYIMTNLRTQWGMSVRLLEKDYPGFWQQSRRKLKSYIENGYAVLDAGNLKLTEKGWLISDRIFSDLFIC